jgi:hypothetical protein
MSQAIVARIVTRPEKSVGGFFVRAGSVANRRAAPPADAPLYVRRADNCQQLARNPLEDGMTAQIFQLRDYQNSKDLERMRQALEREAAEILEQVEISGQVLGERALYGGAGIDGMELGKEPA